MTAKPSRASRLLTIPVASPPFGSKGDGWIVSVPRQVPTSVFNFSCAWVSFGTWIIASLLEADLDDATLRPDEPTSMLVGERNGPEAGQSGQGGPGRPLVWTPGRAAGAGGHHGSCLGDIAQAVDCAGKRGPARQLPGFSAVAGAGDVVAERRRGNQLAAAQDPIVTIAERHTDGPRCWRPLDDRRFGRGPAVATIGREQNACLRRAAGTDPGALSALGRDTGPTRRERRLTVLGGRELVADVLPRRSICGADHRKSAVDGVGHGDAALAGPERKTVVEAVRVLVLKLQRPGPAAVGGLVNAGVGADAGRQQIGRRLRNAFDIAELQAFSPGNHGGLPGRAAVRGERVGSAQSARPGNAGIDRADRLEPVDCPALLRRQRWAVMVVRRGVDRCRRRQRHDSHDREHQRELPETTSHA